MKGDKPSLQMVVEGGRLVPAGPYEAEVLASYPQRAVLTVEMHQRRSLPLLKKYWAVLRDVLDTCKTPWESPDEASDALKLALGVTDIGKTVTGQWYVRAGSISFNSMDQAAFRDFFDKAMALLARVTGIDPLDLDRRYAHIPEHEPSASPADESGDAADLPSTVAASDPQEGGSSEEGDNPGSVATEQPAPSSESSVLPIKRVLMEECVDNMLRDAFSEPADQQAAKVEKLRGIFLERQNLGDHAKFVNLCAETVLRIVGKPSEKARARDYLMTKIPAAARDEALREVR